MANDAASVADRPTSVALHRRCLGRLYAGERVTKMLEDFRWTPPAAGAVLGGTLSSKKGGPSQWSISLGDCTTSTGCQVPPREHLKYPVYPLLQTPHSPLTHPLANRNERDPVSHHSLSPQVMTVLSGPMSKSQLRRVQKDARRSSGMRSCSSYSKRRTTTKSN